jgi:O-antigen/teichoic acid export membrane protein
LKKISHVLPFSCAPSASAVELPEGEIEAQSHQILSKILRSEFLRHNAIFFVGSVGVGVLNYLYYPILGRLLPPSEFGELQALVSLFLQLTVFLTVLSLITVNLVANYKDKQKLSNMLAELEKAALFVGIVLLILTTIFSDFFKDFLQFESALPFVIVALAFVVSIPLVFRSAYVRGRQAFGKAAAVNLAASGIKIVFSALLVVIGLGTAGAIFGIVGAQFLAFLVAAWWAYKLGLASPEGRYLSWPKLGIIKPELRYAVLVFVGSLFITLLYSIDIIVVKHYFDAHTAGLYAGVATVARIIFFLTASVVQVMLPSIKLKNSGSANQKILFRSLALVALVSTPALAVFILFPELTIQLLMGKNYTDFAHLLPLLGVVIFTVSILNLLIMYFVSLRHYSMTIVAIIVAVALITLMVFRHENLEQIVENLLIVSLATLCLLGTWTFIQRNKPTKET